jgi:hypothetical protein
MCSGLIWTRLAILTSETNDLLIAVEKGQVWIYCGQEDYHMDTLAARLAEMELAVCRLRFSGWRKEPSRHESVGQSLLMLILTGTVLAFYLQLLQGGPLSCDWLLSGKQPARHGGSQRGDRYLSQLPAL